MGKKYEMIPEGDFFRIKAIRSFGDVKKGDLGGLIEKDSNLSHVSMETPIYMIEETTSSSKTGGAQEDISHGQEAMACGKWAVSTAQARSL